MTRGYLQNNLACRYTTLGNMPLYPRNHLLPVTPKELVGPCDLSLSNQFSINFLEASIIHETVIVIFFYIYLCLSDCIYDMVVGLSSPSTMWIRWTELRLSGLVAFTYKAMSLAPMS